MSFCTFHFSSYPYSAFVPGERNSNPTPAQSANVVRKILRTLLSILTIIFLTGSCSSNGDKTSNFKGNFDTLHMPSDSLAFYFPLKEKWKDTTNNSLDTFVNAWYSKMLFALKEPILYNYQGDKEIYRFTWLRTFHNPVSVRLEKQNNVIRLLAKICKGAGGYEPDILSFDTTILVTTNEWTNLKTKIEDTKFWQLKTEKREDIGSDGSEWIIEANKENKYHLVIRWLPSREREGNFRDIGEYLVFLSKIKIEKDLFY